jgi:hypothetical protein
MAKINCPDCTTRISETAGNCPQCGCQLTPENIAESKRKERNGLRVLIIIFGTSIFVVGLAFSGILPAPKSPSSAPSIAPSKEPPPEVVTNSSWDGSVYQVESWLEKNVKDPDSLEFIEWSPVSKTKDGGFMVRAKFRAKNSFGGYVIENKLFFLDSTGSLTNSMDL